MFDISKDWFGFSINLGKMEEWCRANLGEHYVGNSAGADIKFHFSQEPLQAVKDALDAQWALVDVNHEWATSYVSQATLSAAVAAAKLDAVSKTYDQLSTQQKKILLGVALDAADNAALIAAFPA